MYLPQVYLLACATSSLDFCSGLTCRFGDRQCSTALAHLLHVHVLAVANLHGHSNGLRQQRVMLLIVGGAGTVRHVNDTAFALPRDDCGEEASARVEDGPEGFLRIVKKGV